MNATAVLTRREREIVELIAWGECKKGVASRCHIAVRTVENHVRNIYEKTGVTKVNELSAWYFCTHYNIPLTMSPLIRRAMAVVLLAIFSTFINLESNNLYLRARRVEQLSARPRRSEELYLITA
jgi:DNA-binding CsgD family transcriptional regulator